VQNYLATWRRVRRYAVPASMIAKCTERRLAGDWAGALRAARVDAAIDLARVAVESGRSVEQVEADLRGLAPDLLRWNLPRDPSGMGDLMPRVVAVLSGLEMVHPDEPVLVVRTPSAGFAPQRLRLEVNCLAGLRLRGDEQLIDLPGYLWRADQVHMARQAHGGSGERLPRFRPDGTPLQREQFAKRPDPHDPAALAEAVHELHLQGQHGEALRLAGIEIDDAVVKAAYSWRFAGTGTVAVGLADEIRRLARRHQQTEFRWGLLVLRAGRHGDVQGRKWRVSEKIGPVQATWPWPPPDLDLVSAGLMDIGELHPVMREVFFPGVGTVLPGTPRKKSVMVRCQGVWHEVGVAGGRLRVPHDGAELRRERLLRGLGGQVGGCAAVEMAWRTGTGWLPKALRAQRAEFFAHVLHGDTEAVVRRLDEGFDPLVRDGQGRSLMHYLAFVDHEELVPRLLAAGLDIDDTDRTLRTPLHQAVMYRDAEVVRALLAAGADPAKRDEMGTVATWVADHKDLDGSFRGLLRRLLP
jgi:hypothetical protein